MYHAAFIAVVCGTEILLVKRKDGSIGLPGGKLNANEAPEEGARRELYEETGLTVGKLTDRCVAPIGASLVIGFFTRLETRGILMPQPDEVTPYWGNFNDLSLGPSEEIISFNKEVAQCFHI